MLIGNWKRIARVFGMRDLQRLTADQVEVGNYYIGRVTRKLVPLRIVRLLPSTKPSWLAENLATGRTVRIPTPGTLRKQISRETAYRLLSEAQQQRTTAPDSTLEREEGASPSLASSTAAQNATLPAIVRRLKEIQPAMFLLIQAENKRDPSQPFLPSLRAALLAVQRHSSELEQYIPK